MSGGEPFMHPRYIELCHKLTKKHYISINTNLTFNSIDEFINEVDPERVAFLHCSLHYQERVKHYNVSSFIKKYHKLKDAGYHIYVTQVFYPPVIPLFHRIVEEFGKENIVIRPKLFRGLFEKKLYPQQYTAEEKQMFRHYLIMAERHEKIYETHIDPNLDRDFFMKELSFKGKMCSAGQDFVNVHFNGDIVRCHASTSVMGNIFKGNLHLLKDTTTCPFTICPCPYYGLRYTQNEPLSLLT